MYDTIARMWRDEKKRKRNISSANVSTTLSQCVSNSYRSTESMKSSTSNIKTKVIEKLTKGNHLYDIMSIINMSKTMCKGCKFRTNLAVLSI